MSMPLTRRSAKPPQVFAATTPPGIKRLRILRLSVTELCNFRCRYCMPAEGVAKAHCADLLRFEELTPLVDWLASHTRIDQIRLTGGEPLLRPGIGHLVVLLSSLPTVREVSLTTNGTLLPQLAWSLKTAGLTRVTVSLDSLDADRFSAITRGGRLNRTLAGIEAARDARLFPIKLNAVLLRSTWRQDLPGLLDFAALNDHEIRFIEIMRTGTDPEWYDREYISIDEVRRELQKDSQETGILERSSSPAFRTVINWQGTPLTVGWIAPRSHPFCSDCQRLRMNARGQLRRCLMDPRTLDLPELLSASDPQDALDALTAYLAGKVAPDRMSIAETMRLVGG